ncbi:MAG: hypothetical protein KKE62_16060 [Proteobacteria bacterium]|nr:hypothetical protein [Pseudomonadota bacterium]MBU1387899.1 hypothetical protein [Pseudomonadota bacterium]MBU1544345.1 hypothetical protein [Pseudomonadota bacterium]MBU2430186.1 hypothetical protein [Pseudomonadota bacterium]
MRDCVFLLADTNMKAVFEGFLDRERFHLSLQCGNFEFTSKQDLVVASGDNDPGLYTRGHELLKPYVATHNHAVIVLDAQWDGSPGPEAITEHITTNLLRSGWKQTNCKVIVIDPELENWIWQKSDHVAKALGLESSSEFSSVVDADVWPDGQAKPDQPKETLEAVLKSRRIPRSSSIYKKITCKVSISRCQDASFLLLKSTFQSWFPMENGH